MAQGQEHRPTAETIAEVTALAQFGIRREDIATYIDVSLPTLRKHYGRLIDRARIKANFAVTQTLYRMATSGDNVAASIFWTKTRMGWSEKVVVEHTPGATPVAVDWSKLSNAALEEVRANIIESDHLIEGSAVDVTEKD